MSDGKRNRNTKNNVLQVRVVTTCPVRGESGKVRHGVMRDVRVGSCEGDEGPPNEGHFLRGTAVLFVRTMRYRLGGCTIRDKMQGKKQNTAKNDLLSTSRAA